MQTGCRTRAVSNVEPLETDVVTKPPARLLGDGFLAVLVDLGRRLPSRSGPSTRATQALDEGSPI